MRPSTFAFKTVSLGKRLCSLHAPREVSRAMRGRDVSRGVAYLSQSERATKNSQSELSTGIKRCARFY